MPPIREGQENMERREQGESGAGPAEAAQAETARQQAAAYLQGNAELRAALGAAADARLEPHYLGAGEHNCNFWFREPASGRRFVLRVNVASQPFHDDQVAYEHAALACLAPSGCAPEAVYLDNSPDALGKGVLVISFCEGDELDFDRLRPGDLQCAAQLMANIHAVPVGDGCPVHRPHDPLRELFGECLQRFKVYRASAFEDARITKWAERFIAAAERVLDTPCCEADRCHIVNTETLPSHFLIPAQAAAEAAAAARESGTAGSGAFCRAPGFFVDWERPIVGEVAQDVAYFVSPTTTFWDSDFLFPASDVEGFVEDYWRAVGGRFPRGSFDARFRAYRVMTALRSVTWCCKALITYGRGAGEGSNGAPAGGASMTGTATGAAAGTAGETGHTTQKTAEKLPVYLSDNFMEMLAAECFGL